MVELILPALADPAAEGDPAYPVLLLFQKAPFLITHPSERKLALHLLKFPDLLLSIANELLPNRLTDYLYTLSELFNAFFRDCRVLGSPEEKNRLHLTALSSKIFEAGLSILGIRPIDKM